MVDTGLDKNGFKYSGYAYRKVQILRTPGGVPFVTYKYTFRTDRKDKKNVCYIVILERYDYNILILKFYPKQLQSLKNKYNIITGNLTPFEFVRVLATCAKIALKEFAMQDPCLSFGFIGAETMDHEEKNESKDFTQRFRIYEPLVPRFFDPKDYDHAPSYETSAYAVISKQNGEPDLLAKMEEMFRRYYINLFDEQNNKETEEEIDSPR